MKKTLVAFSVRVAVSPIGYAATDATTVLKKQATIATAVAAPTIAASSEGLHQCRKTKD